MDMFVLDTVTIFDIYSKSLIVFVPTKIQLWLNKKIVGLYVI